MPSIQTAINLFRSLLRLHHEPIEETPSIHTPSSELRYVLEGVFGDLVLPRIFVGIQGNLFDADLKSFTTTHYAGEGCDRPALEPLFAVLGQIYEQPRVGTLTLRVYDNIGTTLNTYRFEEVLPTWIGFGELDYSSVDNTEIEVTWSYEKMTQYGPNDPEQIPLLNSVPTA